MGFQGMLMKFALIGLLVAAAATQEFTVAKPGCQDRCGNISIPYPFGLTDDCYLDPEFLITCNETFDPPRAFLTESRIIVTEITLEGKLHIITFVSRDCYNTNSGTAADDNTSWSMLRLSKFVVSDTDNMFVAIGCNTEATVLGSLAVNHSYVYKVVARLHLPKGVPYFNVTVSSYQSDTSIADISPCSYTFIKETKSFKFASTNFSDLRYVARLPLVLDWNIGVQFLPRKLLHLYASEQSSLLDANSFFCDVSVSFVGT
ncbi:wall-associated receptor kinase 1-like [Hevea brasiliensis]|uniref:wall-associated receptor kinase 1-like n=1 Tax=Hevea brasiliensis TaxID=3981 RepID=UPI0025D3EE47|nr:wall-associated receptor kinase 1-like [Hevea brasiliensis]